MSRIRGSEFMAGQWRRRFLGVQGKENPNDNWSFELLGICFLRGAPEDVVVEIGEGEKGGYGGKRGWNKCIVMGEQWSGKRKAQKVKNDW